MISAQDFQACLQKLLSPNNQERGLAEKTLHTFSSTHPSEYVQASLDILSNQQATESQKVSSLVLMKKTIPLGKLKQRVFLLLNKDMRSHLQIFLLKNLNENPSEKQRNMVCDLLAEITSSLYNENQGLLPDGEKWENLFQFLKELFATGQKQNLISVYKIIQSIIEQTDDYMQRHKDDLIKLLEFGFKQEDFDIKFISYLTLSKLVQFFRPQIVKQFKVFQYPFLQFVESVFQKNDEELLKKVLAEIYDICSYSPNFIKKYYKQIFIIMSKIRDMNLDDDQNSKIESVECLVNFVQQYPDLVKTNEQITPLVEIIFKNMLEIEDDISAEWCSPPDGFNDDLVEGDDQKVIKAAMHCLDTLFKIISEKTLLPIIFNYLEKMLTSNNWKYIHAAIMSISQIAEYIEDEDDKLSKMVEILLAQKDHQNPRI